MPLDRDAPMKIPIPAMKRMVFIFVLAGAFAQVAKAMGAVDSTVNFGLSILPTSILVPGVFIIASFIALSVGTSMGTIVALVPIAVGISEKTGIAVAIVVGAAIVVSDIIDKLSPNIAPLTTAPTTIATARTQG